MYKLRNNKNVLVVINLNSNKTLHLFGLEFFNVEDSEFTSPDLQAKIRNKFVSVVLRPIVEKIVEETIEVKEVIPAQSKQVKKIYSKEV